MSEYYNGRRESRTRTRSSSLCNRCGKVRQEPRDFSSDRGSWADKGRGLSLEVDGREGRRQNSSTETRKGSQGGPPRHCYILPIANGQASVTATTYRESFSEPSTQGASRRNTSAPTSPLSTSTKWPAFSASSTQSTFNRRADSNIVSPDFPSRFNNTGSNFVRNDTTYRDHFTWLS